MNPSQKIARGSDYILCYEKNIAKRNDFPLSHVKGHYIKFPRPGNIFDFRGAEKPVWVAGDLYNPIAYAKYYEHNVQGKVIHILWVRHEYEEGGGAIAYEVWERISSDTRECISYEGIGYGVR